MTRKNFRLWVAGGALSVADQALFSGTNFILYILLARWLMPDVYGAYAVGMSSFYFLSGLHNGLVLEPVSVFVPKELNKRVYFLIAWRLHLLVSLAIGLVLICVACVLKYIFHSALLADSFLCVGIIAPIILSSWFSRCACYAILRPVFALAIDGLYGFVTLAVLAIWHEFSKGLTLETAFFLMSPGGVFIMLATGILLQALSGSEPELKQKGIYIDVFKKHLRYGKWVCASTLPYGISQWFSIFVLAALMGLKQAGAWRALQNLILPLNQTLAALSMFLLPHISQRVSAQTCDTVHGLLKRAMLVNSAIVGAYLLAAGLFINNLIFWLYAQADYTAYAHIFFILGSVQVLRVYLEPININFRAHERSNIIFVQLCLGAIAVLIVMIPLTQAYGITGAAIGQVVGAAVQYMVAMVIAHRSGRQIYKQ